MYLLNNIFVGWVIVATAPELCQKGDFFFLKQWMKEISAYVLEFTLTSAKMQDDITLMWKNFENWG